MIASDEQQTVYGCEHRTTVHLRDQDNVPPAVVQGASSYSLPAQRTDVPELSRGTCACACEKLVSIVQSGVPALCEFPRNSTHPM